MRARGPQGGSATAALAPLLACGLLVLACGLLVACGETARRAVRPAEDLAHPYGGVRMRAVGEVRRTGDTTHVPALIELLDDDDPGVRMAAGSALVALTGHDPGYEPWADAAERRAQVEAWRAWWATR
jgi:HEAT repeat protein